MCIMGLRKCPDVVRGGRVLGEAPCSLIALRPQGGNLPIVCSVDSAAELLRHFAVSECIKRLRSATPLEECWRGTHLPFLGREPV